MKRPSILILCLLSVFLFSVPSPSLYALKPRAKYFRSEEDANNYLTMRYNLGSKYYNQQKWRKASSEFEKVIFYFPSSDAAAKAAYYLAICYFNMKEYDFANEEFSNYLKASQHPDFFEDAVYYKFCIAEHFKRGKKRRPFTARYLPKWLSAQDSALVIYDEVVAALPNHELAIQALYSKAELLEQMREYRDCVETYQIIIRRFPKHEIVPICYLNIAEAYVKQARLEYQNPDILALAELNVRKFKDDFPRDERVATVENSVCRIKELYARGLYSLGLFYERICHPDAAAIYFKSAIEEFPDTNIAQLCRSRLICLGCLKDEPPACEANTDCENAPVKENTSTELSVWMKSTTLLARAEGQEYVHYSLIKKREMQDCAAESRTFCEQQPINPIIEGCLPAYSDNPKDPPSDLWHYSAIKHRDQYVPCED